MTDHGKWQDDAEAWQEHYAQGGPHEIPGLPGCISRRGQAARVESGKAAYETELADYKRRLAEAMAGGEMLIMPDTPVYGVTGPALSGGGPSRVRVSETSPGTWHPDPGGTHWLTTVFTGGGWRTDLTPADPAGGKPVMIPQPPMPDCTCSHPQDTRWAVHHPECPARRRLCELIRADAAAEPEQKASRYWQDRAQIAAGDPPEDPVDSWWRVTHALGRGLTYSQLAAEIPDQPPGMCILCRLLPAAPGRAWCEDCAEIADAEPATGQPPARAAGKVPAKDRNIRSRALVILTTLGVACVVLAMTGIDSLLIIPGIILLGFSLSLILKGEWR